MKWIDQLHEHSAKQTKQVRKRNVKPASAVQEVVVMVRRPSGSDPGEIVQGYYVVEDGALQMVDQSGAPLKDSSPVTLNGDADARSIAASLTKRRWSETRGGFWGCLSYEPPSIA
jgi:hypothetical protein